MAEINSREDVQTLVHAFYTKIRRDELLGPIFNSTIPNEKWDEHLIKLTDFWESNLFGIRKFKGNPTQKHIDLDMRMQNSIEQKHFSHWIHLWFETINELFEGERAEKAKNAARKMSTMQFIAIWKNRQETI